MLLSIMDLIAVVGPDATYQPLEHPTLQVAPRELTFRFSLDHQVDPATLSLSGIPWSGIQLSRTGTNGLFYDPVLNPSDRDDVVIRPGWAGIGDHPNEVIVRFAEDLPQDLYRATIVGQGSYLGPDGKPVAPLKDLAGDAFRAGQNFAWNFTLDLAPQVVAVVPQPVTRNPDGSLSQSRNTIEVYFSPGDQMGLLDPSFFQLIDTRNDSAPPTLADSQYNKTGGTATPNDDVWTNPSAVAYTFDNAGGVNKAVLTFGNVTDLADFGAGSLRLRIGNQYQAIQTEILPNTDDTTDVGSSYGTARDLSTLGGGPNLASASVVVGGTIQPLPYGMQFPGGIDEPGHRDLPTGLNEDGESHLGTPDTRAYGVIDAYTYSFPATYTYSYTRADGATITVTNSNLITNSQKQSVREIFALFQNYFGVQFEEIVPAGSGVFGSDISVILGDPAALGAPSGPTGEATWSG
jgi:hypothetical protein